MAYGSGWASVRAREKVFVFVAELVTVRIVLELARDGGAHEGRVSKGESKPSGRKLR